MKNNLAKPTIFTFESYHLDQKTKTISFLYSFNNGLKFTGKIILGGGKIDWNKVNRALVDRIIFNLQLALGISYYKTYCPKKIIIKSGTLSKDEAKFWNKLYTKGLGELFYKNKIDYRGLINFPYQKNKITKPLKTKLVDRALLPWGGGKDSALAAEILKDLGQDFSLISLRDSDIQRATAKIAAKPRIISNRLLDPKLIELNKQGVYNGHIPISAIYAWTTILTAVLKNYRHIVFANEASANFGNVKYLGEEINHQYSKSLEFENDLRDYLKNFVTPDINYFSLLRQFSELKITKLFSKQEKYFPTFSSCNRNFSFTKKAHPRWCGECPKCLFAFSQLAAFVDRQKLIKIFGQNLFAKKELLPLFQELWGEKKFKPFDCVGTPTEVNAALLLTAAKKEWSGDFIVKYFQKNIAARLKEPGKLINEALKNQTEHNTPLNFRSILILGYGLEGQFAYNYLRKKYPNLKFGVADQKPLAFKDKHVTVFSGKNYLTAINKYEVIVKSPGISDREPEIIAAKNSGRQINSITNLFLSTYNKQTIGVTGTKGKSTTASLIYQILKTAGKKAYLIGNIGYDPLQHLVSKDEQKIFVYELSSYQLATAVYSPHVAVFINIFPDHLPYHRGFNNYFQAKTNITKFQAKEDFFVFNSQYPALKTLARKTVAAEIDYLKKCSVRQNYLYYGNEKIISLNDLKLLGRHNLQNIMAAICAVKLYKVSNAAIKKALTKFTNLEHRLEFVGKYQEISFYDDAISTTPESTLAALEVFQKKIGTIILGGEDRGYKFAKLADRLAKLNIANVVLLPDSGQRIAQEVKRAYRKNKLTGPKILHTTKMETAVKFAYQNTKPGQVCLLSTASPSYSLFKDFKEKGNLFQQAIKKYRS
ncbi:MAG: UDP-N-acetylmuramoyl-L-alanine--D-glutamate ligase [Patescibacteria group bacterium]